MHHSTFTLVFSGRTNEEVIGNLNFRRSEFFSDLIALAFCEDIASLYDHHLVLFDIDLCEKTATLNWTESFLSFG